jgi:hypothetical protein
MFERLVTRRNLLKGAAAVGAATVVASAASQLSACSTSEDAEQASSPVVVDEGTGTSVTDTYEYQEELIALTKVGEYTLPLGTVLHVAEGSWIPATATGSSANPIVQGCAFSTESGQLSTVVSETITGGNNYVVYDVRMSDSVYVWVELNVVTQDWVLYASAFSNGSLAGSPVTLWKGDADWDAPQIAVSGKKVLWQVMPLASGSKSTESSNLYLWSLGDSEATLKFSSPGRFACEPTISDGVVTIVPRVNADQGVFYGMEAFTLSDNLATKVGTLVLPQSVKPMSAVRMGDNFVFQIEANYSSGGLLSKMGTYIGDGESDFVYLSREPSAAAAGKGDIYIVKSRSSYIVTDTKNETYSMLTAQNRSVDHGEYPARVGTCSTFVTFCTVKDASTGYPDSVVVRTYTVNG